MVSDAQPSELLRWIPALPLAERPVLHGVWLALLRRPFRAAS